PPDGSRAGSAVCHSRRGPSHGRESEDVELRTGLARDLELHRWRCGRDAAGFDGPTFPDLQALRIGVGGDEKRCPVVWRRTHAGGACGLQPSAGEASGEERGDGKKLVKFGGVADSRGGDRFVYWNTGVGGSAYVQEARKVDPGGAGEQYSSRHAGRGFGWIEGFSRGGLSVYP